MRWHLMFSISFNVYYIFPYIFYIFPYSSRKLLIWFENYLFIQAMNFRSIHFPVNPAASQVNLASTRPAPIPNLLIVTNGTSPYVCVWSYPRLLRQASPSQLEPQTTHVGPAICCSCYHPGADLNVGMCGRRERGGGLEGRDVGMTRKIFSFPFLYLDDGG